MKITLTKFMHIELEKPIQIDMHKHKGKISEKTNKAVYDKLSVIMDNTTQMSYDSLHCSGYLNGNKSEVQAICFCKGIIKKISSFHMEYESVIVGQHVEKYEELTVTECSLKMYYNSINCDIYERVLGEEGKVYEINKKSECLLSFKDNILEITVRTLQQPATYKKLIEIIHYMYEVIFLTEGFFPKRIDMNAKFTNADEKNYIYYCFEKSYQGHKSNNTEIGAHVFKRETILKEWILFRKKTDSLFDYYLYSTNNLQFLDVDLFHLITVLEGYSKYTEAINNHDKKRRKKYIKLYDRIKSLNENTPECKIIFSRQIENEEDYVLKLVEHRNDFSHQFQYKKPFNEEEMSEYFHKINLLLRILFFREVGVDVQDRQIRAIIRKYFKIKRFVPTYSRSLTYNGEVLYIDEE